MVTLLAFSGIMLSFNLAMNRVWRRPLWHHIFVYHYNRLVVGITRKNSLNDVIIEITDGFRDF